MKLVRSCLFTPCDRLKVMKKSITLNTDYIIFDLEDSVSPLKKKVNNQSLSLLLLLLSSLLLLLGSTIGFDEFYEIYHIKTKNCN